MTLEERFWSKVDKNGPIIRPKLGPCWVWTDYLASKGYGFFWMDGKTTLASRAAWFIQTGKRPIKWILHKCDNPSCMRLSHLFEGTAQDNVADMDSKGRRNMPSGEAHFKTTLTAEQVSQIRLSKDSRVKLAKMYGVHRSTIHSILTHRTWRNP